MRAFCLISASDKACSEYVQSVAKENDYTLIALPAKEFPQHEKDFFTDTLDYKKCLFYLFDAHKLTQSSSEVLFKLIEASPQRFILSGPPEIPWFVKKFTIAKHLDNSKDELTTQLQVLLTESNRRLVREYLKDADLIYLFNILKFGAWQNPETLGAMLELSRNVFKVRRDYFLTMMSYLIPNKVINTFHKKTPMNPLEASLLKKLKKRSPVARSAEIADTLFLMKSCKAGINGLELSEEEEQFLGVNEKPEAEQVFAKAVELTDFF